MRLSIPLITYRSAKWALTALAIVALTCVAKATPANITDDFTGPLDPAWNQAGYALGHYGISNGVYWMEALQGGGNNPKLQRSDTAAGALESYTYEVTLQMDTFTGTQSDLKCKSFGPDGFMELVLSGANLRLYHNNQTEGVGGNLKLATNIGISDSDVLQIILSYDAGTDTINVAYTVNGGALTPYYSGTGSGGSIGNVIGNFIEFEVFKFGAVVDTPFVGIDELNITTAPVPPIAVDDSYEATLNTTLNVPATGVLTNDIYTGGLTLNALEVSTTADGSLTLNADGSFDYIPDTSFVGTNTFTYQAYTTAATSEVATVTIAVLDPEGITAVDDGAGVALNGILTNDVSVLENDIYTGGLTLNALEVAPPADGTLSLNTDGTYIYTPDPGFLGEDTFTYQAYTSARTSEVATVTVFVFDPEAITANDDAYDAYDGVELAISAPGVLDNDDYTGGETLSSYEVSGPSNGSVNLNTDGSFTYTATPGFIGADSFTYEVYSTIRTSNVATVTLNVADVETSLVVNDDSYAGGIDEALIVSAGEGVLSNDEYAGASLTALLVDTTANGVLSLSADGSFTYTPNAAFIGFDGFTYQALTSGGTTSAVVQVTLETADPSIVNILFQVGIPGNGISDINVVAVNGEVALPLQTNFNNGTGPGASWGGTGLTIGGSDVTFTTTEMSSFSGTVYTVGSTPQFSAPNEGLGVISDDGGKIWMIDGSESFTWQADKDLVFEGIGLRAGFDGNQGERSFSISSSDWIGLIGVSPDTGITYNSGSGTFTIVNIFGNVVGSDNDLTAEEMVGVSGPSLNITTSSDITFTSLNGPSVTIDNFSLSYAAFSANLTVPAPVVEIAVAAPDVIVSWDGVSGASYALQSKLDLLSAWGGDVTGFAGPGPHSVTNSATDAEFYRVIVE